MQVDVDEMRSGANRSYNAASFAMEGADALSRVNPASGIFGAFPAAESFHGALSEAHSDHVKRLRHHENRLGVLGDKGAQDRVGVRRDGGAQRRSSAFSAVTEYPSLVHISVAALIGEAGGDPWKVDETLQSGDPGAIADLGRAFFYSAGACTAETYAEFEQAQQRFRASWNRENGEHPINDSAEVQRATTRLMVQRDQLPAIGADLSNIAANLAETQRFSGMQVENLNTQLHYIDALIDQALAHDQDTSALEDNAIAATSGGVLHQVEALRDDYGAKLEASLTDLRAEHGYDPAPIEDVDGDGQPGLEQRGRESTDYYDANQRAKDEALVNSDGPMTQEKADAAARLRDFATATNPAADADARRLAGERLDDFRMAHFVGPLPKDPILGGDARSRAQGRLDLQRKLEQGGCTVCLRCRQTRRRRRSTRESNSDASLR